MRDFINTVTADEAKRRICPMRQPDMDLSCSGPICMAWRWVPGPTFRSCIECADPNAEIEPTRPANVPDDWVWCPVDGDPALWTEPDEQFEARRRGYCGLSVLHAA